MTTARRDKQSRSLAWLDREDPVGHRRRQRGADYGGVDPQLGAEARAGSLQDVRVRLRYNPLYPA